MTGEALKSYIAQDHAKALEVFKAEKWLVQ
jgi:tripartite-type tricarboxylate transporter receptor subunit TctC